MDITAYRDEIRLRLTGGLLDLELEDITLDRIIQSCLREIQRYICSTKLITVPFTKCIDLSQATDEQGNLIKVSAVARVYRTEGLSNPSTTGVADPMVIAQWQLISGTGNMYNFQNYMYNYASWNTLSQIRNTSSTDLAFRYDKASNKLYINIATGIPRNITIEYVPVFENVSEITSDYWTDVLVRMCVATAKIIVGRIRTRYTENGALWTQDGEQILSEGTTEITQLREELKRDTQLVYGID